MFKIESYITPLLMGYVDKYVKLRPEDFQLSLWGGDAVLYNLDLRLDVIEKVFQLPIVFQSGHIHELRLHIPWTKLGYEPVVVTINTIECILKLRDTAYSDKHSSRAGSEARTKTATTPKAKVRKQDADALPPGYLQSLMNKIVNNVNIIVNNLIIKFVEDDIVLSLNVKSAECYSVDKDWTRSFVELSAPDFVLRRAINFCDLTICLDKRDASGKIEHYQDPVMYRCSVSSRLYSKYEGINAKFPLETKWNVFCERFDLSVTDTQLPMFLRIIELALAIYYGTLEFQKPPTDEDPKAVDEPPERDKDPDQQQSEFDGDENNKGWVSWAWSYVPQILPEDEESGSLDSGPKPRRKPIPPVFSMGMYAYKMSVKFKVTEFIKEKSHYGPKKISFKPFMYMEAEGISLEMLMQGLTFFDAQFGITNLRIFSQGVCICGAESEEQTRNNILLSGGEPLVNKQTNNYIYQSLFDPQCPENLAIPKQQILDFEEHKQIYTEQYGLQKYGVFWMDYLYSMPRQEEEKTHSSRSSVSSMGEPAGVFVKENSLSRFVVGKCHLNVSSTTVHRVRKVLDAAYKYEYESYSRKHEERVDENRPHPTEDQVKSLEEYIPCRTLHLTLLQPVISVLSAEHPYCDISKRVYRSQHSSNKNTGSKGTPLYPLFGMQMSSQRFDLQVTSPMYPRKLVQLVSKIAGPPSNLLHHCHSHTQIKLFGFHVGLTKIDVEGARSPLTTVLPPASGAMYIRRLLLPMYWNNMYLPKLEKVYELPQVSVSLTKGNLLVVMEIMSSWQQTTPKPADITTSTLLEDVFPNQENVKKMSQPVLEVTMYGLELKTCRNDTVTACSGNLSAIQTLIYKHDGDNVNATPIVYGPASTDTLHTMEWMQQKSTSVEDVTNELVSFTYQLPRKTDQIQAPAAVLINVEGICCNLDPVLMDWFSYIPNSKVVKSCEPKVELDLKLAKAASPLQGDISHMSVISSESKRQSLTLTHSPTTGQPSTQHTKHNQSVEKESPKVELGEKLAKIFPLIRIVQVQVEMKKFAVFLPSERMTMTEPSMNIIRNYVSMAESRSVCDTVVICLPHVVIQSAGLKTVPFVQEIPITSMDGSLVGERIPWNVALRNFSMYTISNSVDQTATPLPLVKPATVNCTMGVSYKFTPPTSDNISSLGLCLHTDMHAVEVSTSLEQIKLLAAISAQCLKFSAKVMYLIKDISNSFVNKSTQQEQQSHMPAPVNLQGQGHTLSITSVTEDQPYTQTSGDLTSLDTTPSRDLEILENDVEGVKLSLWLQATLPKCDVNLLTKGNEGIKLSMVLEDMTMSVDVQDVYSKLKVNLGALSVKHYRRSGDSWQKGPNEGILLTCRDELSRATHIISSKLWSPDLHRPATTQMGKSLFQHSQSRDLAHGCLNVTFTRALRKNVKKKFQKLNVELPTLDEQNCNVLNKFYFHKFVSEICVSMNPCDVVLCMTPFVAVLSDFSAFKTPKPVKSIPVKPGTKPKSKNTKVPRVTCSNHPLIYADFAAIRLFVPRKEATMLARQKNELCSTICHDMILLQTQSVTIIPHAENPLPRYAVDKELYQQAVQLGVTTESGSALQDRQYQVDVKGFSIATGGWEEFPKKESVSKKSVRSPTTQIPAVEWNTVKCLMGEDKDIQLIPILSPSDLKLVAAPAIVNTTPGWANKLEEQLVCGYSLEFNVVSDLDLHVSTNQVQLMEKLTTEMTDSLKNIHGTSDSGLEDKESMPDSGLGSDFSMATEKGQNVKVITPEENSSDRTMKFQTPVDVLLTAGRISLTVYSHLVTENEIKLEKKHAEVHHKAKRSGKTELEWRVDLDQINEGGEGDSELRSRATHLDFQDTYFMNMYDLQNQGHEVNVIPAESLCIKPFLFVYISQPHTVLFCHEEDQKLEISCYDILAKGPQEGLTIQATEMKMMPDCSDFTSYLLETRAGQPNHTTGVPPSFCTFTVTNFITQPADILLKLERPVKSNLSFVKLRQFEDLAKILVPQSTNVPDKGQRSTKPNSSRKNTTSLELIKRIGAFNIQTEQVMVSTETKPCTESPGITFSSSNINFDGDIQQNTKGDVTAINCNSYLRDVFVKISFNEHKLPLFGPFSLKLDGSLSSFFLDEKLQMSQSIVTIATGLVPFYIGQEHVLCLKMFSEHLEELIKEFSQTDGKKSRSSNQEEKEPRGTGHGKKHSTIMDPSTDDLRSGDFQYVIESDKMTIPGEIAFCSRDREGNSTMTWTYSMPRVLSHVSSTPIPFNMVGPDGDNMVECVLQHWEPLIQQFVDYVDVDLSDSTMAEVSLPDVKTAHNQDLVIAQTWRILIKNFNREETIMPTSLAASMKIDSCFMPELVPTYEVGCTMECVEVHLSNHLHCLGKETPSKLRPFFMSCCYPASGEFSVLTMDNILCAGSYISGSQARIQGQFSSSVKLDLLEYKTLTMQKVVSPFEVSGLILYQTHSKPQALDVDINCEPMTVRLGQAVTHTLYSSLQAWNQVFSGKTDGDEIIFGQYVICNDTQLPVRFGQVGTDENLILQPREMHQYRWRSHRLKQELHLCLDGKVWKWCEPFEIGKAGSYVRGVKSVDHQYTVIVRVTKLSNVQNQIVISGQLLVSNRLSQHLEVKVATYSSDQEHRAVVGSEHTIPSYILDPADIQGIKFRPWGSRGVWSKEVFVSGANARENSLVKVTFSDQKSSFHIWCRVFSQTVDAVQQIFVVLCPLYTLRSHLPYTMYINIDTSKLDLHQQIETPGRGQDLQLICAGGDVHHALTFQLSPSAGQSSTSVTLSTGLIDQLERSPITELDYPSLQGYWKQQTYFAWPYSTEVISDDPMEKPDKPTPACQELRLASQPTIDLNVSLSELWPGCPTVLVDITTACLVTNMSDLDLVIMGTEDISYDIPQGQTLSPPKLEGSFHVGIKLNDTLYLSAPVPLSEEELEAQRYRNDVGKTLYVDSHVTVPIFTKENGMSKVYFLTVSSSVKHKMQVISLRERIYLTNYTRHDLNVCTFVVPQLSGKIKNPVEDSFLLKSHKGCHGDQSDLHPLTFLPLKVTDDLKDAIDNDTAFIYYLTIQNNKSNPKIEDGDSKEREGAVEQTPPSWTTPIRLSANENGCKSTSCVTLTNENGGELESVPLCITGQEKKGVVYFVIEVDKAPTCHITNKTLFPLCYGQTLMNLSLSGTTIQEQTELVEELPVLHPDEWVYYTPPYLNSLFPQIQDKHSIPKLHISAFPTDCDDKKDLSKLAWSQPIDLLMAADNFVIIPGVTDVKVHVTQVAMVTYVSIEPVTKADVSALEIRSRLKGKDTIVIVNNKEEIPKTSDKLNETLQHRETMKHVKPEVVQKTSHPVMSIQISVGVLVNQFTLVIQNETTKPTILDELIRLTVDDLFLATYPVSRHDDKLDYDKTCFVMSAGDVQLDNQSHKEGKYDFPVVLMRQNADKHPYSSESLPLAVMNILEKHAVLKSCSVFHLQVVLGTVTNKRTVIESVELTSKPLSFYIDDSFIFRCIKEAEGFLPVPLSHRRMASVMLLTLPSSVKCNARTFSNPIVIGYLCLQPVDVLLSVHASLKLFIASNHSPLSFGKFEKKSLCTSSYHLTRAVAMHYASGALFRAGAVVGSLEILGNPTGLVRSIGTGVADFFRMPYRGLTRGPGAFVMGVSHGTSSMVKNVTTGMLKSVTNFASSVSRNMDRLSFDGSHLERQEESRRHRPDGVGEGLMQGLTGLGISLLGAIAGLADQPIQSLVQTENQSKTTSLMTGMGKGLVGVFTKPIGGAAEFVSQTGQGILQGTGLSQYAKPRVTPEGIQISESACGQLKYALKLLPSLPSTDILCCIEAQFIDLTDALVPVTLILTPEILFLINHEEDSQQQSFSVLELECGVTVGDRPILNIVQRDLHTSQDQQFGPSNDERVTAFIDGASKFVAQEIEIIQNQSYYTEPQIDQIQPQSAGPSNADQGLEHSTNDLVNLSDVSSQRTPVVMERSSQGRYAGSGTKGEQLSDTQSDSSSSVIQTNFATLPQYDFYMSATRLAAFLAIFNMTKHKLENVGFSV